MGFRSECDRLRDMFTNKEDQALVKQLYNALSGYDVQEEKDRGKNPLALPSEVKGLMRGMRKRMQTDLRPEEAKEELKAMLELLKRTGDNPTEAIDLSGVGDAYDVDRGDRFEASINGKIMPAVLAGAAIATAPLPGASIVCGVFAGAFFLNGRARKAVRDRNPHKVAVAVKELAQGALQRAKKDFERLAQRDSKEAESISEDVPAPIAV